MENPIDVIYCWQAVLACGAIIALTQLVKTLVDVIWGHKDPEPTPKVVDMARVGRLNREQHVFLNRFLLPMLPPLIGVAYALLVPARPDPITAYVHANLMEDWTAYLIYASWGAACGQFSDYVFTKTKSALLGVVQSLIRRAASAVTPQDPTPPDPSPDPAAEEPPGNNEG